jgi:short-subunit dehydrogenase
LITGASGGIGGALARRYAQPGRSLILQGRDPARLESIVDACRALGAEVQSAVVDFSDRQETANWLEQLATQTAIDLLIVNAGITSNVRDNAEGETWDAVQQVIDVNLHAAMHTVNSLLPAMRRQGRGQIALISSLSAYHGLGLTPAYCASKAALKAYGEALRGWLGSEGIAVNVVLPGFVETSMSARFPAAKPFMLRPDKAAQIIERGLARNRARISFPFPLNLAMWGLSVLPTALSERILRVLGYGR